MASACGDVRRGVRLNVRLGVRRGVRRARWCAMECAARPLLVDQELMLKHLLDARATNHFLLRTFTICINNAVQSKVIFTLVARGAIL